MLGSADLQNIGREAKVSQALANKVFWNAP